MIADALSTMFPRMRATATPGATDDFWYRPVGSVAHSGVTVNADNSLQVSAVYGCVRVLRESLGSLPWNVYERLDERNKEKARGHYLWRVLHDQPNHWMTPQDFKELAVNHLCLRGNFYANIIGSDSNMQLLPLNPDRMEVTQGDDTSIVYKYHQRDDEPITYRREEILHIRGMSLNGVNGISVIEYARNSIGAAIAQENHGSSLFKNGALPTFWISRPAERKWTPTARQNFREEWKAVHAGSENAGQPPILGDGMELHELGLTNRDSQWIEARGFSAEEICRFFGVAPHMIGIKSSSPMGSIEQQSLEFVIYTLGPLAVRFEQAANRDLVGSMDTHYTKIVMDALLRADLKSRYEAHNISVQGGWGLINEVREIEDRNPIEGGDEPRYPMNMQPAGGMPDQNEQGGQPGKGTPKQQPVEEAATMSAAESARPAFEILLTEAAGRIASHEISHLATRAKTARTDRKRWNEWALDFYSKKHVHYVAKLMDPICAAWLSQTGGQHEPDDVAKMTASYTSQILDPDRDPSDVLAEWQDTRADTHVGNLNNLFFGAEI